ncbi:site-specific recombinase XerD [Variovorax boronicumulans]|uniref:Site-specific recombinase XerD n=1 Tax=Variovorax boronicumulans TaxID=436515 RepID=A0AAW8DSP7_9BURK|nr:hypothetical protein [Variovorax boronicumulans]MDP9876553.1 site-specific recombinase XerD [Variovorax boronicumulans]MDP9922570.1 site-specific recombinase XerD [Variovorax boronicumulans]
MLAKTSRLHLSRTGNDGRPVFLIFDLLNERLVRELTDYAVDLAVCRQLSGLTIEKKVRSAMGFWEFSQERGLDLSLISNAELKYFRNESLVQVMQRRSSHAHQMTAKRTVNDKLNSVLDWLKWCAKRRREQLGFKKRMGSEPVREIDIDSRLFRPEDFPGLLYRNVGSGSKHKTGYSLGEDQLDQMRISFLIATNTPYLSQRNILIADIANTVGLRRGSINSLKIEQFDRARIESEVRQTLLIRPSRQKFGYETEFAFPVWLALRVCDFVDHYRRPLIDSKKVRQIDHQGKIFLSARDGRPLTDRAITKIFSTSLRATGGPKGSSIHALRAKFANDAISAELETRLRRGMDTSTESVATAVALRMGHRNTKSLYAYVSRAQSLSGVALEPEHRERPAIR